jgi:hypothetical protein
MIIVTVAACAAPQFTLFTADPPSVFFGCSNKILIGPELCKVQIPVQALPKEDTARSFICSHLA